MKSLNYQIYCNLYTLVRLGIVECSCVSWPGRVFFSPVCPSVCKQAISKRYVVTVGLFRQGKKERSNWKQAFKEEEEEEEYWFDGIGLIQMTSSVTWLWQLRHIEWQESITLSTTTVSLHFNYTVISKQAIFFSKSVRDAVPRDVLSDILKTLECSFTAFPPK